MDTQIVCHFKYAHFIVKVFVMTDYKIYFHIDVGHHELDENLKQKV